MIKTISLEIHPFFSDALVEMLPLDSEVASLPLPSITPPFLVSSHYLGTSISSLESLLCSPSCLSTLLFFGFFLNFSPDWLSGYVGKTVCAGLPSTVTGAAAHLTVTVICSPLSKTVYLGMGPSRSCPCSTALLYGMTDGSEGSGQLMFTWRPWNLEQSVRQKGWATFWWQQWTENVHDKLLPLLWLLQLWVHTCARPGWRREEHSCDTTGDGADIVLEWTVQKSHADQPIRGLHDRSLSLTYLVPDGWATLGPTFFQEVTEILVASIGWTCHLEHGASGAASAGQKEEVSAVLTVDHPKESHTRVTITLIPISFATLAMRPPENHREMVNTTPLCHRFSSSSF